MHFPGENCRSVCSRGVADDRGPWAAYTQICGIDTNNKAVLLLGSQSRINDRLEVERSGTRKARQKTRSPFWLRKHTAHSQSGLRRWPGSQRRSASPSLWYQVSRLCSQLLASSLLASEPGPVSACQTVSRRMQQQEKSCDGGRAQKAGPNLQQQAMRPAPGCHWLGDPATRKLLSSGALLMCSLSWTLRRPATGIVRYSRRS